MKISLPTKITKNDLLVIPFYEGKNPKPTHDSAIENQHHPDFKGKLGENVMIYQKDKITPRLLLVGLGKQNEESTETWRRAGSSVNKFLKKSIQTITILPPKEDEDQITAFVEGFLLAHYQYETFLTDADRKLTPIQNLNVIIQNKNVKTDLLPLLEEAKVVTEAVHAVRDMVNAPSNAMSPALLAQTARKIAGKSRQMKCTVLNEKQVSKMKMGALIGVGKGAKEKPRLIVLEYKYKPKNKKPLALIGKGVCFDAGGINLKASMLDEMKFDMAGAATILGVFQILSQLRLPLHVVAVLPAVENMLGASAYKPGDVLKSYDGTTIEVKNTDAEGRLILADAIAYAIKKHKPEAIVDVATLTGAAIHALGYEISALITNNSPLAKKIKSAAKNVDEKVWELPLDSDYKKDIKSDIADISNLSTKTGAGTIMGGAFLEHFVKDTPWVHLDMGGSGWANEPKWHTTKGASGRLVRTLWKFLQNEA